ncbi:helix-turn-helix domain-containing protein [Desulfosporosinus sp. SB140]|uniref:helix-turn-helix domain-containing protein n=1 Tax=Desulfosporosinus paludis TaxID=3115649 RepID=UPI003890DD1A
METDLIHCGKVYIEAEKEIIFNALEAAKGNKMQAARVLGVHRSVLYRKLAQYNHPEYE